MPADYAPSVLVTGIHTLLGATIASRFYRGGWFVLGCDASDRCSYQARNHIPVTLNDPDQVVALGIRAGEIANGLDLAVVLSDQQAETANISSILERTAPVITVHAGPGADSVDWIVQLSTGGEHIGWASAPEAPDSIAQAVWDLVDITVPVTRYDHSH
jgi:NAD(P)-dependent dehydrogenase (short-subunit alcohol dehydrogenase family)